MTLATGTKLGRYEIRSKIGAGGMGEVYLAQDTKLDRKVALKTLPADLAANQDRMRRFVQEAKAASALNHPNIITIYEIEQIDSVNFIAIEFIDGETLREHMRNAPMKLAEVLDVAAQVASAFSAAHAAGIVHRDIKPENIMLRHDGIVKVLDFGLAKLSEPPAVAGGFIDTKAATRPMIQTEPGTVMGTVAYMSPEQVRGLELDARTDIWSLGVVLYEMLVGRTPFAGETSSHIGVSILEKEPAPITRYAPQAPVELQRIVRKTLAKARDDRYQTVRDLLIDLKTLRRELDLQSEIERSAAPDEFVVPPSGGQLSYARTLPPEGGTLSARPTQEHKPLWRSLVSTRRTPLLISAALAVVVTTAFVYTWRWKQTHTQSQPEIKSLAVLPLKSLDPGENYLGLGIADAVIRRINQTGELIVRPTSAVRRYLSEDTDALTAARQLNADAVLEGSLQRADDRLRVSVNLLRTSDGSSLWTDSFDMRMTDVFTIQDTVSQQVASRLRLQLDPSQQARLTKRYTSNPMAYEFYVKGVYSFDQSDRNKMQMEAAIDFFKKAIEADPNFALAHAQLAFAYAAKAIFMEPTEPVWVERAREEIDRTQALDAQLAETHLARFLLLWSGYEGYQNEAAVRELLLAQQLNPNVGHANLGALYSHIGLEDFAARELQRALDIDPTSEFAKGWTLYQYQMAGKYDEWLAAHQKLYPNEPISAWYFLGKGRLEEAQKALEERSAKEPNDLELPRQKALLFALKGDFRSAEAMIPSILSKHPLKDLNYHHATYDIACIYALEGKSDEAVKWLRETAVTGFPCYPLFERDAYLNRIRQAPEFIQFMAEMKAQNERYRREFS